MLVLRAVVVLGIISSVWCACYYTPRKIKEGDDEDCEHPDYPDWKIKVGSNFQTPDCLNITCWEDNLSVCEFGWGLERVIGVSSECKKVKVGTCGIKFVKADDESKLC